MAEIQSLSPDIVALTEAHIGSTFSLGGHEISARGVCWAANYADTEQKILLWSREPWLRVESPRVLSKIGGAVVGSTKVDGKDVRVLGVCIPYQHASPFGAKTKSKYFEEHERFLIELTDWFKNQETRADIVVGDFNRGVPRDWGPHRSYDLLMKTFAEYKFVTAGLRCVGAKSATIDHVAVAPEISAARIEALTAVDSVRQKPRSDHFGVMVELSR